MHDDQKKPVAMTLEQIRQLATEVAAEMKAAGNERIPDAVRSRFIDVRAALIQRGIYDPVLIRFDTATVPQAAPGEVADQLLVTVSSL